jgi:hypothetical protein
MTLLTLMHGGPVKTNELFSRLSETSEGAVKAREKLFADLKTELELHINLEEQHLFPILRRSPETKELVSVAVKDNKELRAKLAEIEALPKSDENFPERLKELQKAFRQHARDDKRELLPAVGRALSEAQVQDITHKMEVGIAEAEQLKNDELEARRLKALQEREQAERQQEAERAKKAVADRARQEEAEQKRASVRQEREQTERQQEAVALRTREEVKRQVDETSEAVARTAVASQATAYRMAENVATGAQQINNELRKAAGTYADAVKAMVPDPSVIVALPGVAAGAINEIRSASIEWMRQTTQVGTEMSRQLLRQAAEQQQQLAAYTARSWMDYNSRIMQITIQMAQESFRRVSTHTAAGLDGQRTER